MKRSGNRDGVIRDFHVYLSAVELPADLAERVGRIRWERVALVIELESGITGWALPITTHNDGASLAEFLVRAMRPAVIGEDVRSPERIWRQMESMLWRERPRQALAAVDVAVWDAAARLAGVPVWQLLGGGRTHARACACIASTKFPRHLGELARTCISEGFTAVNLRGFGMPERDLEACEIVRDAVGSGVDLMFNGAGLYGRDRRVAVEVGRSLQELDFRWYEHPLRGDDVEGFRDVRRKLDIPIAGPHGLRDLIDHRDFLIAEAADIIRPDIELHGGLTGQRKAAHMAECLRSRCEPHSFGTPLSQMATLHGICAMPQPAFLELPVPLGMLDGLTDDIVRPDADGLVTVPDTPGLGMTIDPVQLDEMATEVTA